MYILIKLQNQRQRENLEEKNYRETKIRITVNCWSETMQDNSRVKNFKC